MNLKVLISTLIMQLFILTAVSLEVKSEEKLLPVLKKELSANFNWLMEGFYF